MIEDSQRDLEILGWADADDLPVEISKQQKKGNQEASALRYKLAVDSGTTASTASTACIVIM